MAIGTYTLPICDGCKLPWLPVGWKQDSDPRNLPAGAKPLRCGKCKTIGWDREHAKQQKAEIEKFEAGVSEQLSGLAEGPDETVAEAAKLVANAIHIPLTPLRIRCKHRMTNCPICHKEAA